jgi:hypothetical protein
MAHPFVLENKRYPAGKSKSMRDATDILNDFSQIEV